MHYIIYIFYNEQNTYFNFFKNNIAPTFVRKFILPQAFKVVNRKKIIILIEAIFSIRKSILFHENETEFKMILNSFIHITEAERNITRKVCESCYKK
jgi:hypothetical protein